VKPLAAKIWGSSLQLFWKTARMRGSGFHKRTGGSAGLWKMPVDAGPEAQNLQKLFRFNDLSQKAGKGTPDDPTRCHDDFAFATGLKRVAQD
jgi:hypothetical protein